MIYRYPQEIHDFVKEHVSKLRDADLAQACNDAFGTCFTAQTMKSFRGNHGYRNGRKQWTSEEYWKYQKRYPKGMYEFVATIPGESVPRKWRTWSMRSSVPTSRNP